MGPQPVDLTGRRYGSWLVLYRVGPTPSRQSLWKCECECGNKRTVQSGNLKSGRSTRCRPCADRAVAEKLKATTVPINGRS